MERIDCTSTFVDAPGFRPTALEADMPIIPTLMAAPRAAKPTWMFPPSRFPIDSVPVPVSNAIIDISAFLLFLPPAGRYPGQLTLQTGTLLARAPHADKSVA